MPKHGKTSQVIYAHGHRDARHAAAEMAIKHDQEMERVKAENERLKAEFKHLHKNAYGLQP